MPAPTTVTTWAINDVQEVVNIGGNNIIVFNKVEPTASYLNSGTLAREPFPRPYINYMLNSHGLWIDHVHQGDVGDYRWMPTSTTATDMANRFGGTWNDLGTADFTMTPAATETLRLFVKTA